MKCWSEILKFKRKEFAPPQSAFSCTLFYSMLASTVVCALFHLFGLDWFQPQLSQVQVDEVWQQVIMASLKVFELVFVLKMLTLRPWWLCLILAAVEVAGVGFIPQDYQWVADLLFLLLGSVLIRKGNKLHGLEDFVFIQIVMNLYGILFLVAKHGVDILIGIADINDQVYSFISAVAGCIDYKLFVVTIYAYSKYKGGFRLWKRKRKFLSPM